MRIIELFPADDDVTAKSRLSKINASNRDSDKVQRNYNNNNNKECNIFSIESCHVDHTKYNLVQSIHQFLVKLLSNYTNVIGS